MNLHSFSGWRFFFYSSRSCLHGRLIILIFWIYTCLINEGGKPMIDKLGQVMLYVNDQEEAKRFWTEAVGFQVVAEQATGGMRWVEVAPNSGAGTTLVLHNKEAVASMSPGLN